MIQKTCQLAETYLSAVVATCSWLFFDQIIIWAVMVHQSSRYVLKMMEIYICHTEKFADYFWLGIWENANYKLQYNHLWLSTSVPGTKGQSDLEIFCNLWGYLNCRRFHGFHGNGKTNLIVHLIFIISIHDETNMGHSHERWPKSVTWVANFQN